MSLMINVVKRLCFTMHVLCNARHFLLSSEQSKQYVQGKLCRFVLICCRLQVQQESHQQTENQQTVSNENSLQISVVSDRFAGMSQQERQTAVEQVIPMLLGIVYLDPYVPAPFCC